MHISETDGKDKTIKKISEPCWKRQHVLETSTPTGKNNTRHKIENRTYMRQTE